MRDHRHNALLFILNGIVATGVQYIALVFFIEMVHVGSAGSANGLASLCGISASYLGNRFVVFRMPTTTAQTLPRFLLLYGFSALFSAAALWLWSDIGKLAYTPGFILITGFTTLMSYLGNRYFVFQSMAKPAAPQPSTHF